MKRLLTLVLLLSCFGSLARAADKIGTLVLHPEETVYARFEVSPKKIKLVSTSKEPDTQAQVVFSLTRDPKNKTLQLKVENRFPSDLVYRAEMRSKTYNLRTAYRPTPVVAQKLAFESLPGGVEEFAVFDFKLQK